MSTPHIAAEKGEIAERILLPGDPLRAKFIAEHFLDDAKEYTHVRNILGYTGTYKGVPVSVCVQRTASSVSVNCRSMASASLIGFKRRAISFDKRDGARRTNMC